MPDRFKIDIDEVVDDILTSEPTMSLMCEDCFTDTQKARGILIKRTKVEKIVCPSCLKRYKRREYRIMFKHDQ